MKWIISIFCFCLFKLSLCQGVIEVRVDPSKAYGGSISEYFDSVEFIPLETTAQSRFGAIGSMVITDSGFVIFDNDTKSVLFFQNNGKFIKKVTILPNYYATLSLSEDKKKVFVYKIGINTKRAFVTTFSLTGKILSEVPYTLDTERFLYQLETKFKFCINTCKEASETRSSADNVQHIITIYDSTNIYKSLLQVDEKEKLFFCTLGFGYGSIGFNNGIPYFSKYFSHEVYHITKDSAVKKFQFIFPVKNTLPKTILCSQNKKEIDSVSYSLRQNQAIILGVRNINQLGKDIIFFNVMYLNTNLTSHTEIGQQFNLFYNLKSKHLVSFERLSPDSISKHLPILDGVLTSINGIFMAGKYCYSNISSLALFAAKEKTMHKNPQYPPALQQYFKTQNRKSNPVIVRMKLKEGK